MSEWFAWHGFSLSFPDNWLPTVLTGNYVRGYVRWEGERGQAIQIRWLKARAPGDLRRGVEEYLLALRKAGRRRGLCCQTSCEDEGENGVEYSWKADIYAYGRRWFDPTTSRIFSLERWSPSKVSLKREVRRLCEEIETYGGAVQPWSLLGVRVLLPVRYWLRSWKLLSGYTELNFQTQQRESLVAARWAFAQEILRAQGLAKWAQGVTGCFQIMESEEDRVCVRGDTLLLRLLGRAVTVLVRYDREHNRILLVKSVHGLREKPDWSWLL